jgi:hypothetical protein
MSMLDTYNIWLISIVAATGTMLVAAFIFIFYIYLISRLPDAVWLKNLKERVLDQEAKRDELSIKNEELHNNFLEIESAMRDAEDAMSRAVEEKNRAEIWLQENAEDIANIEVWKQAIVELRESGEEARQQLADTQQERLDAEEKKQAAEFALSQLENATAEAKNNKNLLEEQSNNLKQQITEYNIKIVEIRAEFVQQQTKLQNLKEELSRLQTKIEAAELQLNSCNANRREAENAVNEASSRLTGIKDEIEAHKRTLGAMGDMVSNMETQIKRHQPPALLERLEDFHRPILELPPHYSFSSDDEQRLLQHFTEKLVTAGYVFHERTIHAFHTSLKISDISPLVVLAGISGTGKSQLPRLYAKYMGMHFMNVAVQPRWDAPEDLFGFYNYMEHRYKATELARALRQMDMFYHSANNQDEKELQGGMLLVLLDEMNLARVEYYFSEMLSKLEMRDRSLVGDEEMHALSAIQIQAGSLSQEDGVDNKPLFVGYNVLFVGTMNEDETTQALSDKVIDRSNVLRFGRPGNTTASVLTEEIDMERILIKNDNWNRWIKQELDSSSSLRLNSFCKKLNEALEMVGRPFGHRIHQAIYQYIANYPDWVPNSFEKAFADQLEQKILPKLRGLSHDTDDHLGTVLNVIGEIIDELDDADLGRAFNDAKDLSIFDFKGVNRAI